MWSAMDGTKMDKMKKKMDKNLALKIGWARGGAYFGKNLEEEFKEENRIG
jgi:hypothetical protein